jgi:hypothetical protein
MDGIVKLQLLVDLLTCWKHLVSFEVISDLVASWISGSIDAKGLLIPEPVVSCISGSS